MTNENPLRDRALTFRSLHVPGRPLVLPNAWDTASARIVEDAGAAREAADGAGVPLFVNARVDTFLRGAGGVEHTLERAAAYLAAGADGIFVPGAVDPGTVKLLADGVDGPLNVMAGPGAPPVTELAAFGVARVSVGAGLAQAARAVVRRAARELLDAGTYESLAGGLDYGELNSLLGRSR
ncbi:isocitrate lyase/phosphoenolpyruvate mutase family protein [Streptomyces sp. NPDC059862]|uniref:isocitrate lyase/phosphoenolpyruvate mutase family protein n=1 Tax=unclassified Streptomyces TaxID=2593676 RepID=UPI00362CA9B6